MLRITERPIGDVMMLDLAGRMAPGDPEIALRDKVEDVSQRGYRPVVLNLGRVSGSDTSAISALHGCYLLMRDANGELKLLHLTPRITNLLIIRSAGNQLRWVALHDCFPAFDSEAEALASFRPTSASAATWRNIHGPPARNAAAVA